MIAIALAAIPLLIWIYLLLGRGGFWREFLHTTAPPELPRITEKRVAAIIPARDEAAVIGQAVTSLLLQDFPAPLHIFVVDDGSTDGTADLARHAAERAGKPESLTVIEAPPLAPGWTGKLWALAYGIAQAEPFRPDYLLFSDADIYDGPNTLRELVAIAATGNYELASYMVALTCRTVPEKALLPAFAFFFLKLYPPAWVRSQSFKTAAAAGGCVLIRPAALEAAGGLESIRNQIIDDCALARAMKRSGGRTWMGLTREAESIRPYSTFAEIGRMISRTAFDQLHHSPLLLILTVLGMLITYVLPIALLFSGQRLAVEISAAALVLMACAYTPAVRFYKRNLLWVLALPLIALFYAAATVHSAIEYWRGRGGLWKGRIQDMRP